MATPNEEIANSLIRRQVYLSRYAGGLGNEIVRLLDATERDLERQLKDRLARIAEAGKDLGPAVTARLKALYDDVRETRASAFKAVGEKLTSELGSLAGIEAGALKKIVEGISPIDLNIELPKARQLSSILGSLFGGDTLNGWLGRAKDADFNRIKDQIAIGYIQGETTPQIADRIFGTSQLGYKDGVTQITRNGAKTLARTATNHVANSARQAVYAANSDIFSEELYVATLDSRTSPICRSLDGKTFPTGTGPIPPLHPNCRSTRVPVIGELLGDRASQFGPVPAAQTYGEWLKNQPASFQDDVLGPERGKLFRLGGLPIDRFNDASGKLYTLEDLKVREPGAFAKAFGPEKAAILTPEQKLAQEAAQAAQEAAAREAADAAREAKQAVIEAANAAAAQFLDDSEALTADVKAAAKKAKTQAYNKAYNAQYKAKKAAEKAAALAKAAEEKAAQELAEKLAKEAAEAAAAKAAQEAAEKKAAEEFAKQQAEAEAAKKAAKKAKLKAYNDKYLAKKKAEKLAAKQAQAQQINPAPGPAPKPAIQTAPTPKPAAAPQPGTLTWFKAEIERKAKGKPTLVSPIPEAPATVKGPIEQAGINANYVEANGAYEGIDPAKIVAYKGGFELKVTELQDLLGAPKDTILVVEKDGLYYLKGGGKEAAARLLAGGQKVQAKVVHWNDWQFAQQANAALAATNAAATAQANGTFAAQALANAQTHVVKNLTAAQARFVKKIPAFNPVQTLTGQKEQARVFNLFQTDPGTLSVLRSRGKRSGETIEDILQSYRGSGYGAMNEYLRAKFAGKNPALSAAGKKAEDLLDAYDRMAQSFPFDVTLERGTSELHAIKNLTADQINQHLVGSVYKEGQFVSTGVGFHFQRKIVLYIRARAGTRYIPGTLYEKEAVLRPGSRFMIVGAKDEKNGNLRLDVELLPA